MKISDYIIALNNLMCNYGDLEVTTLFPGGDVIMVTGPRIKNLCILKGRERKPRYFIESVDEESRKGLLVVEI